ncbi:hypothetical protein N7509_004429 [Penicillium cosmopolitanum]|uniref:Enoyl-CoA hydratase n=1 Tax=Penicillium cosmopolitanum TaxID=1131564 RepID=A0A9W9W7C9_9EURO|nr:uncharacterized protein N7509_004429 [Penicillium cosmopolitanum]KAJ5404558.1 hypothetical protein N7509_004429 [Penicillium cosmopolitanum]
MVSSDFSVDRAGNVFVITLHKAPENRLSSALCQELIRTFCQIQEQLGPDAEGAVITRGCNTKFFSTGLDLDERETNPFASSDGFYPLIHTLLDFPYPTIACITGHTFGGACVFALAHDYRIMNSRRGYFCMPPVDLGLHFDGMGSLLRSKVSPQVARKILLEAYRYTGREALEDGIVDAVAEPEGLDSLAMQLATRWKTKACGNVYGVLRGELVKPAVKSFSALSYVHSRPTSRTPKVKL